MASKFRQWYYNSPFGFILGLILLGVVAVSLSLALFDGQMGIAGGMIGGLIGATYTAVFNKHQKKYLKPIKDGLND